MSSQQPVIMRKLEFDAGHRLIKHEGKCRHLHGHRYVAELYVQGDLDEVGRVIDFSKIKEVVGGWIDERWDHGMILNSEDPIISYFRHYGGTRLYVMDRNPTAENMADELFTIAKGLLSPYNLRVVKVRLWETPNCFAEVVE